jgi:IS30 family transposase
MLFTAILKTLRTLLVLTERLSRREILIRMKDGTAASVARALDGLEEKYGDAFYALFRSITVDNGSEFADCAGMERSARRDGTRTKLYYCHPQSAWERGSNEKQNAMLRRLVPNY